MLSVVNDDLKDAVSYVYFNLMAKTIREKMAQTTLYTGLILSAGGVVDSGITDFRDNSLLYFGLLVLLWSFIRFIRLRKYKDGDL